MDDIVNALRRMIGIDAGDEPAENPEPPPQQDDDDQEPQRDDDDDQEPQRDDDDNDDQEAQTQRGSSHSSDSTGSTRTASDTTTATETEEGTTTETTATTEQTADDDGEAEADTNDDQQDENAAQDEDEDEEDCFVTKEEADLYDVTTNGSSRLAVISDEDIISTRSARDNSPPRQDVPAIQAPSDAVTARSSSRTDVHPAAEGNEEATAAGGNEDEPMALQELPSPRRPIEEDLTTARRPAAAAADALDQRRSAAAPAADVQTAREDDGRGTTTTTTTRSHVPARVPNQAELDTQTARRPRRPDPRARREPPCQCYALGRATCTCTFYLDY